MRTKLNLILMPFIMSEVKHISKIKNCDIISSGRESKPVITDSLSQPLMDVRFAIDFSFETGWSNLGYCMISLQPERLSWAKCEGL